MKDLNKNYMVTMMLEQTAMNTVDLLPKMESHKPKNGVYCYALIISKYSVSLKPVNYGLLATEVRDKVKNCICGKFDIFLVGHKEPFCNITDDMIAAMAGGVMPKCQKEVREFYNKLMR
jgi:phosphatidylglycerophosphatase A